MTRQLSHRPSARRNRSTNRAAQHKGHKLVNSHTERLIRIYIGHRNKTRAKFPLAGCATRTRSWRHSTPRHVSELTFSRHIRTIATRAHKLRGVSREIILLPVTESCTKQYHIKHNSYFDVIPCNKTNNPRGHNPYFLLNVSAVKLPSSGSNTNI